MADQTTTTRTAPARAPETDVAPAEEPAVPAPLLRTLQERYGNRIVAEALAGGGGALGALVAEATADEAAGRGAYGAERLSNRAMQRAMAGRSEAPPPVDAAAPEPDVAGAPRGGEAEPTRPASPAPVAAARAPSTRGPGVGAVRRRGPAGRSRRPFSMARTRRNGSPDSCSRGGTS